MPFDERPGVPRDEPRPDAGRSAASRALRAQALAALRELFDGFQAADRVARGRLLGGHEDSIGPGLASAILRMVVVLFAEARGILPPAAAPCSLVRLHADLLRDQGHGRAMDRRHGAWARVVALFSLLREGSLFDPDRYPFLEGRAPGSRDPLAGPLFAPRIADSTVLRVLDRLLLIDGQPVVYGELDVEHVGAVHEGLMGFEAAPARTPGEERRRLGAHYTSRAITEIVVERTLAPLIRDDTSPEEILALQVCDPAMGSGAFLVEACRRLARHLVRAWQRTATTPAHEDPLLHAQRLVARRCLYGVDRSPLAVDLARASLWLLVAARDEPLSFADHALRHGDSLVGLTRAQIEGGALDPRLVAARDARHTPFHWEIELPEVFAEGRGGFDAMVGNPPWVAYAGRAAQPLADDLRAFYAATSPAFHGYRTLQAVFVHRAATLLRPGGRLGLVLPTSMSDLGGYGPARLAHDALSVCDDALPDFGDGAFEGVFQPSMALISTRRRAPVSFPAAAPWPLHRKDLDAETIAILDALGALPRLPPYLFGERGFQTTGDDVKRLHALPGPRGELTTGVRVGGDVEPFLRRPPRLYCDPRAFGGRFRDEAVFGAVKLLIRQTARYPLVALSDGQAFRNSILAGFSDAEHSEHLLLAYLNSAPIRWFHYMRHRDARQGMPQMKIAHLRALPAPPQGAPEIARLERIGRELGARNTGIRAAEQEAIDGLVADALGLAAPARARIAAWATSVRG